MHEVVRVKEEQFPELLDFLERNLPESWVVYARICHIMEGKWRGHSYYALIDTLWPNILAVGEGEVDETRCKCAKFYSEPPKQMPYFAPDKESAKELLLWPGFVDLTKSMYWQGLSDVSLEALVEVGQNYGEGHSVPFFMCEVVKEDLVLRPIPAGMTTGVLTPDMADYVASTWPHNRPHSTTYIAECIKNFPSVTLLDCDGSMVGFELFKENGDMGFLYVEEKYRHKGYAKIIVSLLAKKCYDEGRRAVCFVLQNNERSIRLHEAVGFKRLCNIARYYHPGLNGVSWDEHQMTRETFRENLKQNQGRRLETD